MGVALQDGDDQLCGVGGGFGLDDFRMLGWSGSGDLEPDLQAERIRGHCRRPRAQWQIFHRGTWR